MSVGRGLGKGARANWIRLRTMIVCDWVAMRRQADAITVAQRSLVLQWNWGYVYFCQSVIGYSGTLIAIVWSSSRKQRSV